ncbi:MAG: type II secretion protein F [bacterium]|nr:type II secretion protein F [bacterium]
MTVLLVAALLAWGLAHVVPSGPPVLSFPDGGARLATLPRLRARLRKRPGIDVGEVLTEVATRLRAGVVAEDAWNAVAVRHGLPEGMDEEGMPALLRALPSGSASMGAIAAWRLASELGAPLADILDECALALTHAEENDAALAVALAGPVASARMLAALPIGGILIGSALGSDPLGQLAGGGMGSIAGLGGLGLYAVGLRWSARLVRSAKVGA